MNNREHLIVTPVTSLPRAPRRRLRWLLASALTLALAGGFGGESIRRYLTLLALLRAPSTTAEQVRELTVGAMDPLSELRRFWATGRITHRLAVMEVAAGRARESAEFAQGAEFLFREGARDADSDVRERALGALDTLANGPSPHLPELARLQLADLDPQRRLLGLQWVRRTGGAELVPLIIPLVQDADATVAASADALLRTWTGNDVGVRIYSALGEGADPTSSKLDPVKEKALRDGLSKWREWWSLHATNYGPLTNPPLSAPLTTAHFAAGDFTLPDLENHAVSLHDFRGRVVLINFWATWCNACLTEIPDLIALQKRFGNRLVVLAICLDGRPDEHDHEHEHEGGQSAPSERKDAREIQEKVRRLVHAKGINYPILLNPAGEIGARFNGGELPTNVILDAAGRTQRRFIGTRSAAALDAMCREAGASETGSAWP